MYRHQKKNGGEVKNSFPTGRCKSDISVDKILASQFTTLADMTNKSPHCGTDVTTEHWKSNINGASASATPLDGYEPRQRDMLGSNLGQNEIEGSRHLKNNSVPQSSGFLDEVVKYQEFKILVNKYYSKENAEIIMDLARYRYVQGKDDLDERLAFLRTLDQHKKGSS